MRNHNNLIIVADFHILSEFEKRALQIIKDNWDHFKSYKEKYEKIESLMQREEFATDLKTVESILNKYIITKSISPLDVMGYQEFDGFLGLIEIKDTMYYVSDELFDSNEGIDVIKNILNLLDIDYECRVCLVRPMCRVYDHFGDCIEADELCSNQIIYNLLKDIIDWSDPAE